MKMKSFMNSQKAFSLVELMVVIAIIGILSAIAVPSYKNYVTKSRAGSILSEVEIIQSRVKEMYSLGASTIVTATFTAYNYPTALATTNIASIAIAATPTQTNCTGVFAGSTAIFGLAITGTAAANSLAIYMDACVLNDVITWVCGSAAGNLPSLPSSCQSTFSAA